MVMLIDTAEFALVEITDSKQQSLDKLGSSEMKFRLLRAGLHRFEFLLAGSISSLLHAASHCEYAG